MPLSPQRRRRAGNLSLATVNPSGASRTNLNNPEQIRTNLNTAERPDQIGGLPGSPPNTPEKANLNTAVTHSQHSTPHLTSPLSGGRDELGEGGGCGVWGGWFLPAQE